MTNQQTGYLGLYLISFTMTYAKYIMLKDGVPTDTGNTVPSFYVSYFRGLNESESSLRILYHNTGG